MFGRGKAPRVPGRIDTLIGRGTRLRGELEFIGGLHVDGEHAGDLRGGEGSMPSTLWVGEPGRVRGSDRVVLGAKARVTGDVTYGVIEMTLGARVDGRLIPLSATAATAIEPTVAATPAGAATADPTEASRTDNVLRPFELRQGRN
jgi:cytoskeletal protein CcmA (bactofilin family)